MMRLLNEESAFTLIEILIAITIVGISFVVIIDGYISLSSLIQQMKEYQLISTFANNKLNQVIQKIEPGSAGVDQLGNLKLNWKSLNEEIGDGLSQVMIIVEWTGQKGRKEFKLTTLIAGGTNE